ncbi:hypothetical protein AA0120_g10205 [Alternaria tenuissima]|nr:hypothetical protein AA0120_g10205 [Alternaria tenuissima]
MLTTWNNYSFSENDDNWVVTDHDEVLVVGANQISTKNTIKITEPLITHANTHYGQQTEFDIRSWDIHSADCSQRKIESNCGFEVSFERTPRMPDDNKLHQLPGSLGSNDIYSVGAYMNSLPNNIKEAGGVFLPMWQREAMWLNFQFKAQQKCAVRVFIGRVNAISGSKLEKPTERKHLDRGQDYIVVPDQKWLDGICIAPGIVRQFVAMPLGSGYTVEGQKTAEEKHGGFQLEITPEMLPNRRMWSRDRHQHIRIRGEHVEYFNSIKEMETPRIIGCRINDILRSYPVDLAYREPFRIKHILGSRSIPPDLCAVYNGTPAHEIQVPRRYNAPKVEYTQARQHWGPTKPYEHGSSHSAGDPYDQPPRQSSTSSRATTYASSGYGSSDPHYTTTPTSVYGGSYPGYQTSPASAAPRTRPTDPYSSYQPSVRDYPAQAAAPAYLIDKPRSSDASPAPGRDCDARITNFAPGPRTQPADQYSSQPIPSYQTSAPPPTLRFKPRSSYASCSGPEDRDSSSSAAPRTQPVDSYSTYQQSGGRDHLAQTTSDPYGRQPVSQTTQYGSSATPKTATHVDMAYGSQAGFSGQPSGSRVSEVGPEANLNPINTIEPKDIRAMGLAAGGRLIQDIYKDTNPATTWNHAAARILNVHILDPVSCEKVTHIVPRPPTTDARSYAAAGGKFFVVEEKVNERLDGGDFDNVKSISQMDQFVGVTTEPELDPTKPKMCTTCEIRLCDCIIRPCDHQFCNVCIKRIEQNSNVDFASARRSWKCPTCDGMVSHVAGFSAPMNLPGEEPLRIKVPVHVLKIEDGRVRFEGVQKTRI